MKKYGKKIAAGAILAAVLVLLYWWGGNAPSLHGFAPHAAPRQTEEPTLAPSPEGSPAPAQQTDVPQPPDAPNETGAAPSEATSEPAPEAAPEYRGAAVDEAPEPEAPRAEQAPDCATAEPQEAEISDSTHTCTFSVRCDTILDNISHLDPGKAALVPPDGVIFAERTVSFYEGETVFHVLAREMKRAGIHLEFSNTPAYDSAYIEGIGNLYEFDCGELSGWMYRVNGRFPNYGCSRYRLSEGDRVEWLYTCDLGADVGGGCATNNGR